MWSHKGNVVAAGAFKDHVKLNFFKGDIINEPALKELIRAAAAFNPTGNKKK